MRATEYAPRGRYRLLERIYGLAEIVERVGDFVKGRRVHRPHLKRLNGIFPEDASGHGQHFAQHRLGFVEVPQTKEGDRVVHC